MTHTSTLATGYQHPQTHQWVAGWLRGGRALCPCPPTEGNSHGGGDAAALQLLPPEVLASVCPMVAPGFGTCLSGTGLEYMVASHV